MQSNNPFQNNYSIFKLCVGSLGKMSQNTYNKKWYGTKYCRMKNCNNHSKMVGMSVFAFPIPKLLVKKKVEQYQDQVWDALWKKLPTCRQTRAFTVY